VNIVVALELYQLKTKKTLYYGNWHFLILDRERAGNILTKKEAKKLKFFKNLEKLFNEENINREINNTK
jgi:hypothetical protein